MSKKVLMLLLFALLGAAAGKIFADDVKPFIGFDAGFKRIKVKECEWTIRNLHPHLSFYTGVKLTPYIGLEGGGHLAGRKTTPLAKIDSRGLHLTVLGYWPFIKNSSLLGGAGVSHVTTTIQNGYVFEIQKALPRLMCGLEVPVLESINFRATTAWNSHFSKQGIQHRASVLYNVGFLYYY